MGEAHWIREVTPRTCGGIPLAIAASHLTEQLAPYLRGYTADSLDRLRSNLTRPVPTGMNPTKSLS